MVKAHICPICDKSFTRHYNLQRHRKSQHERDSEDIYKRKSLRESDDTSYDEEASASKVRVSFYYEIRYEQWSKVLNLLRWFYKML